MKEANRIFQLYKQFFLFGCFTFGGGWSIIAQMEKQFVVKEQTLTKEQLLDITGVGRGLPGIMIGNVTFLYGYHAGGLWGALACLFGLVTPPVLILMGVTVCYTLFEHNPIVLKAMAGVRAAVVPIILSSVIRLWDGAFKYPACYPVMALAFVLYSFFHINVVLLVLMGAAAGLVICDRMERRDAA